MDRRSNPADASSAPRPDAPGASPDRAPDGALAIAGSGLPPALQASAPPVAPSGSEPASEAAAPATGSPARTATGPVATLTRVPIDPSQLVDDGSGTWCRHEVRRLVAWHLVGTGVVAAAVLVPLLWFVLDDPVYAALLGAVGAGAITGARLGLALLTAPLGYRYVQRFSGNPPEYLLAHQPSAAAPASGPVAPSTSTADVRRTDPVDVWDLDPDQPLGPADLSPDPAAVSTAEMAIVTEVADLPLVDVDGNPIPERHAGTAEVLRELGFGPVATVRTDGPGGRYVDLYGDADRIVVAVDRTSATVTVLTELAGFRVLVTSSLLVPPADELVVNVVHDGDAAGLVLSHQRLVQQAFRSRTRVSEPVGLFKLAQQRELEAYRELGPLWGAVLDLRCRTRGVRLLAAPSADEVLLFTGNRLFRQTARETTPRPGSHTPATTGSTP